MMKFVPRNLLFGLALLGGLFCADAARAAFTTFTFSNNITDNTSYSGAGFTVTVYDTDRAGNQLTNQLRFRFDNTYGGSIHEVYLQDGAYLDPPPLDITGSSSTVNFQSTSVNPDSLPGGNAINPQFIATQGFAVDTVHNQGDGIGLNEWLDLTYNLDAGVTYAQVVAAMNGSQPNSSGEFMRWGIHVGDVVGGTSDSFINVPNNPGGGTNAVPAPPALVLAVIGLAGFGGVGLRRRLLGKAAVA
jgi:hypothetical protein